MRIVIAAGGSGGHLFPAQQLVEMLRRKRECEVLFGGFGLKSSPFFVRESIPFVEIPASPLGRLRFPFVWLRGWRKGREVLKKFQPDVVVGFGSYHVFPLLTAARTLGIKTVLFEANCALGRVNRFFADSSVCVASQFPIPGCTLVPFLPWISHEKRWEQKEARRAYGLDPDLSTFLVFGGSQGARFLNEQLPDALAWFTGKKQAIHFTGKGQEEEVHKAYEQLQVPAYVRAFEPEMAKAYAAADCTVCRAGAGTIADLIRYQMPALLIPFPQATDDHQQKNGEFLVLRGGARLLMQKQASVSRLVVELETLFEEKESKKLSLQKIDLHNMNRSDFVDLVVQHGSLE